MKKNGTKQDSRIEFARKHGLNATHPRKNKPIECDVIHYFDHRRDGMEAREQMKVRKKK